MAYLQFSETGKRKMIDQLLDHYNIYMELYHLLGDIHFKEEANNILALLHKYFKRTEISQYLNKNGHKQGDHDEKQ